MTDAHREELASTKRGLVDLIERVNRSQRTAGRVGTEAPAHAEGM